MNQSFRIYKLDVNKIWQLEMQKDKEEKVDFIILKDWIFNIIIEKNNLKENDY